MLNAKLDLKALNQTPKQAVRPAPVLITEQEVALGTAAARRTRSTTRRRWTDTTHGLLAAMHRTLVPSTQGRRRMRQAYPRHYAFLERASMAHEMDRL